MGNCCRRESASVWASLDEWDEIAPRKQPPAEKEWFVGEDSAAPAVATPSQQDHVKIKITKRELEELVATARVHDVPVDRLLSRFINAVDRRPRSWAPILHTILE